jgi:serine/threonine protein kinase
LPRTHAPACLQIADFGKARILCPGGVLSCGSYATVTHMAPEVLSRGRLSHAGDVYSFGVLLWSMCTGVSWLQTRI